MKTLVAILFVMLVSHLSFAQAPQGIPYQAIARSSSGSILASQTIRVRFTIRDSVATGAVVYQETFTPTTTALGLFNVNVGTGSVVSGTFGSINWGHNAKFMQVELDPTGGTSYTDMGTTQMMSVPYALHAGNTPNGFTHYIGELFGGGIIFYLWKNAGVEHGLISALANVASWVKWSNNTMTTIGITASNSHDGAANTAAIIAEPGHTFSAAKLCTEYTGGGFTDWYLPAIWELKLLYNEAFLINKILDNDGDSTTIGFNYTNSYLSEEFTPYTWSSTEQDGYAAKMMNLTDGMIYGSPKYDSGTCAVRPVRSF